VTADRTASRTSRAGAAGSIAAFVSPHGFGHAARTAAILEELHRLRPELELDLHTTVPDWFFRQSLSAPFRHHAVPTDVGLVQKTTLEEDPAATVRALDRLFPTPAEEIERMARGLTERRCRLVLADISPLGIAVARAAGIPSVLVENFTWDWIYRPYLEREPRLATHLERFATIYAEADHHLQAEPFCRRADGALPLPPVSRSPRRSPAEVRNSLGIAPEARIVLVSMGGVAWRFASLPSSAGPSTVFVVPGGSDRFERRDGIVLIPHRSEHYHPDLVGAADVVVGKLGYSTVAEAYWGGAGFAYVRRPDFAESEVLERFVVERMPSVPLATGAFAAGDWTAAVELLEEATPGPRRGVNGARRAALRIERWLAPASNAPSDAPA
jgi:hypothetical protein